MYKRGTRKLRPTIGIALLAIGTGVQAAAPAVATTSAKIRDGGAFRISVRAGELDSLDPARSYTLVGWTLLDTTCARLMNYPDKPAPEGLRVVPEVAARYPRVSHDRKTYTFTLRKGFRFSNGTPVRANAFARAINRTLAPQMRSPGAQYTRDIVGAADVQAGKTAAAAGVVARGYRLIVRFTRPVPDFPAQTTMPFFCAVPPTLPIDPEGVGAIPGAGPYYVAEYRRGERVVIRRNRFYGGARPRHVDRFVADLQASSPQEVLDRVERGQYDYGFADTPFYFDPARRLAGKYGVNKSQFFVKPGLILRYLAFNTSRPLFRNNPRLRRAVNFAIDRRALAVATSGTILSSRLSDQYLPPTMPGYRDARIYRLDGPDLRRARALARGSTRGGKVVLYTVNFAVAQANAQIIKRNLLQIGLDVEVRTFPPGAFFNRIAAPDEPYDLAGTGWAPDYFDPSAYLNVLLDGRFVGRTNIARFDSPKYNRLLRRAARLQGQARYRAYGDLDVRLARDEAPLIAIAFSNQPTLVSKRVGCVVLRPTLDLTAVCLRR